MSNGSKISFFLFLGTGTIAALWFILSLNSVIDQGIVESTEFHSRAGELEVAEPPVKYELYIEQGIECDEVQVNISKDGSEYFSPGCSAGFGDGTFVRVGGFLAEEKGTYVISSSHEIRLIDEAAAYESFGKQSIATWVTCCCSLIGLLLSAVMWALGSGENQQVMLDSAAQTPLR